MRGVLHRRPMSLPSDTLPPLPARRRLLQASASLLLAPAFVRHAGAAEVERFGLGVASGHPRADRLVLWTRLTGEALPEQVPVAWELATDESFRHIAARGTDMAEAAWAHSVHAEPGDLQPGRWYWYRFTALGQRSRVGRTRTAPASDARETGPLRYAIASCQRWDHGHYAAWRHLATQELDLVLFLGDYIYEYASPPIALRLHQGPMTRTLEDYRARYAQYKSDPALQAAHAIAPWLVVWDDHEIENDYANDTQQTADPDWRWRRAAATQAYWEHLPLPKAMRPRGTDFRLYGRYDWGRLARIHLLDDRQYRDPQVCPRPGRAGGSNTVRLQDCPALMDPRRSLLGADQERWLAEGWDRERGWNLVGQQTLMSRFEWSGHASPEPAGRTYWTDGWDGYTPSRNRLLGVVAEKRVPNVVVLGGDVHAHYVSDLKADYDDPTSPVIATEFCGTSIASRGMEQAKVEPLLPLNPHIRYARADKRGYVAFTLDAQGLDARLYGVVDPRDPRSDVETLARFHVEAGRAGAQSV